ncbi:MAG: serine/threonine protein kinase [Phycisphaerales bacterium]|nr:serine/threonine protein kinase [Phycisphaerales bacterium]
MAYAFQYGDRPLDGITIQRAVGRGGFGEVYYALTDSGKQVALKFLRDNADVELRGIQNVLNLKSPYLVSVFDVRRDGGGDSWVVMEYISGPSLRDVLIAEPQGLGPQKAAFFLRGIAQGLSYLHERGVVHRDLKPGNIFYDDGFVKIGDYGLSKYIPVSRHSGQTMSVGTVHYMAPEIGSGNYSKAIDVYALGVILFEMLTGRLPFAGSSMGEVLMRHISDTPDLSALPEGFRPIVARALAKKPEDRYPDAGSMAAALDASPELRESADRFDHSGLSRMPLPAREGGDVSPTRTTPPRRVPAALDARDPRWPEQFDSSGNERLQRLERKFEKRAEHWHRRIERQGLKATPPPSRMGNNTPRVGFGAKVVRTAVLLVISVTVALVLGLLSRNRDTPEAAVTFGLFLVGGVIGGLVARLVCLPRMGETHWLFDRLVFGCVGGAFMAPGLATAEECRPELHELIAGPVAMLLCINWRRLIDNARAGDFDGAAVFWAGLICFISAIFTEHRGSTSFAAAGLGAAIALILQVAAGMWPLPKSAIQRDPEEESDDDDKDVGSGAGQANRPETVSGDRAAAAAAPSGVFADVVVGIGKGREGQPAPQPSMRAQEAIVSVVTGGVRQSQAPMQDVIRGHAAPRRIPIGWMMMVLLMAAGVTYVAVEESHPPFNHGRSAVPNRVVAMSGAVVCSAAALAIWGPFRWRRRSE